MTERFSGQRSEDNMKKLEAKQQELVTKSVEDARDEASADVEAVLKLLTQRWTEMGFTPEQFVWTVALVTINMRQTFPDKHGGKAAFDRIAAEANEYYKKNAG